MIARLAGWKGYALTATVALAIGAGTAAWIQGMRWDTEVAELKAGFAIERDAQTQIVISSVEAARNEERRRTDAIEKEATAARLAQSQAANDARAAGDAQRRLRQRIDQVLADAIRSDPTLAERSAPGRAGIDLLAELLGRSIARSGELASIADRARIAGLTCERMYDALRAKVVKTEP